MTPPPGLIHYPDDRPGIARRRCGRGFSYIAPDGTRIDCKVERARINAIAVPPAYEDVWISPHANGHLQATGYDARTRKQYRYHPEWSAHAAETKFAGLRAFGLSLPRLRARIYAGLTAEPGDPELAIAAVLALIDRGSLRVGHPDYTAENGSYGAVTLRPRHARLKGGGVTLDFVAKGGKKVSTRINGTRLARALAEVQDLPGGTLVGWVDDQGAPHPVRSDQINAVMAECCGEGATPKTFRTWNGTLAAFRCALTMPDDTPATIKALAEAASDTLHNTPAIAKSSYIHPRVLDLAELDAEERNARLKALKPDAGRGWRSGEPELLAYLEED
ncbi:DNA topoisomerase [Pacificitalea manganoxidans]|uniref:DNA topoisomerase n=1 Tax=Pacificitalea manganoxidans TaxID=1411902 RepID=A0A291LWK6_9RHOB|nr:DNA topoisomerase IB [Pacificitalea manganoxidans]ATI41081.1 DNA topoisomerase [Pacificitalea manganoxidans]MDR6308448.1 DNA topoisomerase-1 [Pacificitalea manganoxidans]